MFKNWNEFDWLIALTLLLFIGFIGYGIYTDAPNTEGYVPTEKAIRL